MKNCILKKYISIFFVDLIMSLIMCGVVSYVGQDKDLGLMIIANMVLITYITFAFLNGIISYLMVKTVVYPTAIIALSVCVSELVAFVAMVLIDFMVYDSLDFHVLKEVLGIGICAVLVELISGIIAQTVLYVLNIFKTR